MSCVWFRRLFLFFIFKRCLLILSEGGKRVHTCMCMSRGGAERERERERERENPKQAPHPKRPPHPKQAPHAGLELTSHEIMT